MGDTPEDRELVQRVQQYVAEGKEIPTEIVTAMDELFARVYRAVHRYCSNFFHDPRRAEDVAHDTIEQVLTGFPAFRGTGTFFGWAIGIARNLCRAELRKRKDALTEDGIINPDDPGPSVLHEMRREERYALLREAASTLSPLEQEAVELRYVHEISQSQVTDMLGLTTKSGGRGLLQRCRRHLQTELTKLLAARGHGTSLIRSSFS